ncbi:MAG: type II toxin-antitoxin system HigB family toxin [Xanthomonadales bacterium]|nr:type II toxin-antitoxin system HigB family toxin [Xanthomonadales bacterium]
MRVIAIRNLRDFWEIHPEAEVPLKAWLDEARAASWQTPADIKARYANASILKSRRVVFNIKGNDYRLIVAVAYQFGAIYIKFVGTHKQYAAINADTVEIDS